MRKWAWLFAGVVAVGCAAQPEYFQPTEKITAAGTEGQPASSYDIHDAQGVKTGEVAVWSDGAQRTTLDNQKRTVVHVGMRVKNLSDQAITLDARDLRLEAIQAGKRGQLPDAPLVSIEPKEAG